MKSLLFLFLGFGFLLTGVTRVIASPQSPAFFQPAPQQETDISLMDAPPDVSVQAANRDETNPTGGSAPVQAERSQARTVVNQPDVAGGATETPSGNAEEPFLDNSFVTLSQETGTKDHVKTGLVPDRIVIPDIQLDAPIVLSRSRKVYVEGKSFDQWLAPDQKAAGWQTASAHLGEIGNTVINGHHNEFGEVFKRLIDLDAGDKIYVYSGDKKFEYVIANRLVLPERKVSLETRLMNARWIQPSEDERLTLVTCWPYQSNTHRLILVAVPNR